MIVFLGDYLIDLNQHKNIFIHTHFSDAISNATIAEMERRVRESL